MSLPIDCEILPIEHPRVHRFIGIVIGLHLRIAVDRTVEYLIPSGILNRRGLPIDMHNLDLGGPPTLIHGYCYSVHNSAPFVG